MDSWLVQISFDGETWVIASTLNGKYDLDEVNVFARLYASTFYKDAQYQVIHRHEHLIGTPLLSHGLWRIQIKYKEISDENYFEIFKSWSDINVMRASGYASYEEAFKALKDFEFEKYNDNFIWRIIQD